MDTDQLPVGAILAAIGKTSQSVHSVQNRSTIVGAADKRRHLVVIAIGDARDFYTDSEAAGAERQADFQYEAENRCERLPLTRGIDFRFR